MFSKFANLGVTKSKGLFSSTMCVLSSVVTRQYRGSRHLRGRRTSSGDCNDGGISVTYKAFKPVTYHDHDFKNMKIFHRPMSPHLTIFGPTVTSITSICQRMSGVAVAVFSYIFAGAALVLPDGIDSLIENIQSFDLNQYCITAMKFLIAITFTYHYFIGIRFSFFCLGQLLNLKAAYITAYLMILIAIAVATFGSLIGYYDFKEMIFSPEEK